MFLFIPNAKVAYVPQVFTANLFDFRRCLKAGVALSLAALKVITVVGFARNISYETYFARCNS